MNKHENPDTDGPDTWPENRWQYVALVCFAVVVTLICMWFMWGCSSIPFIGGSVSGGSSGETKSTDPSWINALGAVGLVLAGAGVWAFAGARKTGKILVVVGILWSLASVLLYELIEQLRPIIVVASWSALAGGLIYALPIVLQRWGIDVEDWST